MGEHFGAFMNVRLRTDLDQAKDRDKWPARVGISLPLLAPDEHGQPSADEMGALGAAEDMIRIAVGELAIKAIVITMSGQREFVLYSRSTEWAPELEQELRQLLTSYNARIVIDSDDEWAFYDSFFV